jgi:hypothetical protein
MGAEQAKEGPKVPEKTLKCIKYLIFTEQVK